MLRDETCRETTNRYSATLLRKCDAQIFKISRTDRIEMHSSTPFVFFFLSFFFLSSFFFQLNLVVKDHRNQREIETDYICKLYLFPRSRAKFLRDVMSCSVPLSESQSHVLERVF